MAKVILEPIGDALDKVVDSAAAAANTASMQLLVTALDAKRSEVRRGWGDAYIKRVHDKGRLTTQERLQRLIDPGTKLLPVGTLVNYGVTFGDEKQTSPGAGVVTAFARVHGRLS